MCSSDLAIAIDENFKVNIPVTTASTSVSTGSLTTGGGAGIGADLYVGDDAYLITDSAVLGFGADKDTLLTHTDGTGLTLNSTNKLCFNDASQFVQGSSATVLSIGATDEIDLTATAVDLNGTLNVSGVATFQATPVFPDGSLALADLDIDGGTDIGADLVDADEIIVDDGGGGTNRRCDMSRVKTYVGGITAANFRPNAKPLIINGDMKVSQRATSVAGSTTGGYVTVDRMDFLMSSIGTYTIAQEALTSGNAFADGFANAVRIDTTTADASPASSDYLMLRYKFEGQDLQSFKKGTASAEKYTLSFWVKSNKTGNAQVNLFDNDTAGNRIVGATYSISSADTWEQKVVNFPADTTGALDDDNGKSFLIEWFLDSGSNYTGGAVPTAWEAKSNTDRNASGALAIADNTANDWAITGIQLEVGEYTSSTIPPFQHESYGDNLNRCLRYFEKRANVSGALAASAQCVSGTRGMAVLQCTEKRAVPSVTLGAAILLTATNGNAGSVTSTALGSFSSTGGRFDCNLGSSTLTAGHITCIQPNGTTDGITFNAEL